MGGPTNNGPLGTMVNNPSVDEGTLARACHRPPCTTGHGYSLARKTNEIDALAAFDLENAVIWVNAELLAEIKRTYKSGRELQDTHIQTLVHEFTHVQQYEKIFEQFSSRTDRAAAMVKLRAKKAMSMTEDEFVKYILTLEGRAEYQAQLISMEVLHHFSKARGNGGLSLENRRFLSREKTREWYKQNKAWYAAKARRSWRKIRQSAKQHGGSQGVAAASAKKKKSRYTMLPVSKFKSAFPLSDSPKMKNLVNKMVKYDIYIVVGLKTPAKKK